MARLPSPGGDGGIWGDVLNDYLSVSLQPDGSLKPVAVQSTHIADGSITSVKLASGNSPSGGQVLSFDGSTLQWITPTAADATTGTKGVIQLAGDLAGTATNPTVPALNTKITGVGIDAVTVSSIAPSSPTVGDIWLDTSGM